MSEVVPPLSQYAFMAWCSVKVKHFSIRSILIKWEQSITLLAGLWHVKRKYID